mgnify:CR=1 FL=1
MVYIAGPDSEAAAAAQIVNPDVGGSFFGNQPLADLRF